jgi:hypothetical protein
MQSINYTCFWPFLKKTPYLLIFWPLFHRIAKGNRVFILNPTSFMFFEENPLPFDILTSILIFRPNYDLKKMGYPSFLTNFYKKKYWPSKNLRDFLRQKGGIWIATYVSWKNICCPTFYDENTVVWVVKRS